MIDIEPATSIYNLALTILREAGGEVYDAKVAVGWSIRNRVENPKWWGRDWTGVVTKPVQYTSMVPPAAMKDPGLVKYGNSDRQAWIDSWKAANSVFDASVPDSTDGSTHYFDFSLDKNPPAWAATAVHATDVGHLHFYKDVK